MKNKKSDEQTAEEKKNLERKATKREKRRTERRIIKYTYIKEKKDLFEDGHFFMSFDDYLKVFERTSVAFVSKQFEQMV